MKRVIDTSEVLGTMKEPDGNSELCVTAVASYDEESRRLMVELGSFLRPAGLLIKERHFRAPWLPANETVSEKVDQNNSREMARDIFHRWARKVRASAPALHPQLIC
jgi:hypothetical protein